MADRLREKVALISGASSGMGTAEVRLHEWIESLRVMTDLAQGWGGETFRILAWNRHGRADVNRQFGTLRDGGPLETVFVRVIVTDGDRIQRYEVFDVGDTDQALARFAELCAVRAT